MLVTNAGKLDGQMLKNIGAVIVSAEAANMRRLLYLSTVTLLGLDGRRVGVLRRNAGVVCIASVAAILTIVMMVTPTGENCGPCPRKLGVVSPRSVDVLLPRPRPPSTAARGIPIGILTGLQSESHGVVTSINVPVHPLTVIFVSVNGK